MEEVSFHLSYPTMRLFAIFSFQIKEHLDPSQALPTKLEGDHTDCSVFASSSLFRDHKSKSLYKTPNNTLDMISGENISQTVDGNNKAPRIK